MGITPELRLRRSSGPRRAEYGWQHLGHLCTCWRKGSRKIEIVTGSHRARQNTAQTSRHTHKKPIADEPIQEQSKTGISATTQTATFTIHHLSHSCRTHTTLTTTSTTHGTSCLSFPSISRVFTTSRGVVAAAATAPANEPHAAACNEEHSARPCLWAQLLLRAS
jgi:hypothetical protein